MRELWGRGSAGRAMRSQRIGQGFESPRLHQNPKDTAKSVSFGFCVVVRGANLRAILCQRRVSQLVSFISQSVHRLAVRASSAACGARRFRPFPVAYGVSKAHSGGSSFIACGANAPHAMRKARSRSGVEHAEHFCAVTLVEVCVSVGDLFQGVSDEVGDEGEVRALMHEQRDIRVAQVM